jgi:benzoate membrane transport protein
MEASVAETTPAAGERRRTNPLRDLNSRNLSAGITASILGMTGPPILILEASRLGHYTQADAIGWMFSVYFFGGLLSMLLPLLFRIPVTAANSLSGIAFLASAAPHFTYSQMTGAFLACGVLMFLIGISGAFTWIMRMFPREVIASMLAGLAATYAIRIFSSMEALPLVGFSSLACYLLLMKFSRRIPPVAGAIVVGIAVLAVTEGIHLPNEGFVLVWPQLAHPDFSLLACLTVGVPLCLLILSGDAVTAIAALETYDFKPPTRKIITYSGITSMIVAVFGGQSANVAGMMTAVCAQDDAGEKRKRYVASFISGMILLLFAIFASKTVPFIQALPAEMTALVGGFALLGILGTSLHTGFSGGRYRFSSIFAFAITLSPVSFLHISSPVWALVVGTLIAKTIENKPLS